MRRERLTTGVGKPACFTSTSVTYGRVTPRSPAMPAVSMVLNCISSDLTGWNRAAPAARPGMWRQTPGPGRRRSLELATGVPPGSEQVELGAAVVIGQLLESEQVLVPSALKVLVGHFRAP